MNDFGYLFQVYGRRLDVEKTVFEFRDRTCPHCRQGYLDEYTGICNNCGYPEFHENEGD